MVGTAAALGHLAFKELHGTPKTERLRVHDLRGGPYGAQADHGGGQQAGLHSRKIPKVFSMIPV